MTHLVSLCVTELTHDNMDFFFFFFLFFFNITNLVTQGFISESVNKKLLSNHSSEIFQVSFSHGSLYFGLQVLG